jgi:hypothetical protein
MEGAVGIDVLPLQRRQGAQGAVVTGGGPGSARPSCGPWPQLVPPWLRRDAMTPNPSTTPCWRGAAARSMLRLSLSTRSIAPSRPSEDRSAAWFRITRPCLQAAVQTAPSVRAFAFSRGWARMAMEALLLLRLSLRCGDRRSRPGSYKQSDRISVRLDEAAFSGQLIARCGGSHDAHRGAPRPRPTSATTAGRLGQ